MASVSNYTLRLQASLMDELRAVVEEEGTTLNQFISVAVAEKLAALRTLDYIEGRGRQGGRVQFDHVLQKITEANLDPAPEDRLPEGAAIEAS